MHQGAPKFRHNDEVFLQMMYTIDCRGRYMSTQKSKILMIRLGNLGFFLGKLEILIVALSKSTYQSQGSRVHPPVDA